MKTILLKENGLGRYIDVSPFPLGDLTLKITGLPVYAAGEFRLILHINGWNLGTYTVYPKGENVITIPQDKLAAGKLTGFVAFYQSGHEVKRYPIEDLIITALNESLTAYPEIAKIEAKINEQILLLSTQKDTISTLTQSINKLMETVDNQRNALDAEHNKVLALLKFAWADYKENIYIEGETFEEFIKKFGFVLTDEEIKTIKGEK